MAINTPSTKTKTASIIVTLATMLVLSGTAAALSPIPAFAGEEKEKQKEEPKKKEEPKLHEFLKAWIDSQFGDNKQDKDKLHEFLKAWEEELRTGILAKI